MSILLTAACGCVTGKLRKNNEDNFYFDGQVLPADNNGSPGTLTMKTLLKQDLLVSVFDGMGGENFGEQASYSAAACMRDSDTELRGMTNDVTQFLTGLCESMNASVNEAKEKYLTSHMGTTMVGFYFTQRCVYSCNLGDSKSYVLRGSGLRQLSQDHVDTWSASHSGGSKAPITQYLGIDPEEFMIEPYISKQDYLPGDKYLLCSDGISDMLGDERIAVILREAASAESAVNELIAAAMEAGGRDNITAIVCILSQTAESASDSVNRESRSPAAEAAKRTVTEVPIRRANPKRSFILAGCILGLLLIIAGIGIFAWKEKERRSSSPAGVERSDADLRPSAPQSADDADSPDLTFVFTEVPEALPDASAEEQGAAEIPPEDPGPAVPASSDPILSDLPGEPPEFPETSKEESAAPDAAETPSSGVIWENITAIAAGSHHLLGLKDDGTVVSLGDESDGKCDVSEWTDIIALAAGESHTIGLRSDGTVVAAGDQSSEKCAVSNWTDIIAIAAGNNHTVGLCRDGSVVATGEKFFGRCDVNMWTDITAIAAGGNHTVGLRSDGRVAFVGDYSKGQRKLAEWSDIEAIAAGAEHTVGLRRDRTVVATGDNQYGQCDVSEWTEIIAIAACGNRTVGLRSDGTVVATGDINIGQCDVNEWTDITAIAVGEHFIAVLRRDGTVVCSYMESITDEQIIET